MVRTVSAKGSFYGWTDVFRPNRLQGDNKPDDNIQIKSAKILEWLQQRMYSLPVSQKELLFHLISLSVLIKKLWIFVISCLMLFGTTSVNASCLDPNVTTVHDVVVPVIYPCNRVVKLNGTGIEFLMFERNLPYLRNLDVSSNHIENIQTESFLGMESLETLTLSHNDLTVIRKSNFKGTSIESLHLDNNQVIFLFEGAFDGLEATLRYLNLTSNLLRSLTKGVFNNLHVVTVLDVSFNDLSFIHSDAFKGMNDLLKLMLEGNKLTTVSGCLPPVERRLDLSDNRIDMTKGLPQDETLDLNVRNNPLNNCSQEDKDFVNFCSQTAKCHISFDHEVRCDDRYPNSNEIAKYDNTKEEIHLSGCDPSPDSGGIEACSSFMHLVVMLIVSVVVGYYNAYGLGI